MSHLTSDVRREREVNFRSGVYHRKGDDACWRCGEPGHFARNCHQATNWRKNKPTSQEKKLLCAESRILQLEKQVLSMQNAKKRAWLENENYGMGNQSRLLQRLHKLKKERRGLLGQLTSSKEKFLFSEESLKRECAELQRLSETHAKTVRSLEEKLQLSQLKEKTLHVQSYRGSVRHMQKQSEVWKRSCS